MTKSAIHASEIPPRAQTTVYPEPFAARMAGREKRALGDFFALTNFGVNLTRLAPGAISALRHSHTKQDEFIYVLQGTPTLRDNHGSTLLQPGMCAGFPAASGNAAHLINHSDADVLFLEIGDRRPGDAACYPDDDLNAEQVAGQWRFSHKDGAAY